MPSFCHDVCIVSVLTSFHGTFFCQLSPAVPKRPLYSHLAPLASHHVQGGVFGLLTGSQVARFALPAPEPPEGMPPAPATTPSPAGASSAQQEQSHSLQPVSTSGGSSPAVGPVQAAQQHVASEPLNRAQPDEQLLGHAPSSGQSPPALKGAAEAALPGAMSAASAAAKSAGSPAVYASSKPTEASPAGAEPTKTAPANSADEVKAAPNHAGSHQSASPDLSPQSMRLPNKVRTREQAGRARTSERDTPAKSNAAPEQPLQPPAANRPAGNEHQAPSQPSDSKQDPPFQLSQGLKELGKPRASAPNAAPEVPEEPATTQKPAVSQVEDLENGTASAQPAAQAAAERQPTSHSAFGGQHDEPALQPDSDGVHAARPPAGGDDSMRSAPAQGAPPTAGSADQEQGASPAEQAHSAEHAAVKDEQQTQPLAATIPAAVQADAEPALEVADDRTAGLVEVTAELGDSRHSSSVNASREAEQVQHGGQSGNKPDVRAPAVPATLSEGKEPFMDTSSPEMLDVGTTSSVMPDQDHVSQETPASAALPASHRDNAAQPATLEGEPGRAKRGGDAAAQDDPPSMASGPSANPPSSDVRADTASEMPSPGLVSPAEQPPAGSAGREEAAGAASSGNVMRTSAAMMPVQASPENGARSMGRLEGPAGPGSSGTRSTSASAARSPIRQDSTGNSIRKEATDPLHALLGGTQPTLARPPPRLISPLSSRALPRQSTSSGAAAGEELSICAASPMLEFLCMSLPKRTSA